jgi:branched-chain amino acid transport system substrate-binding protein
MTTRRQVHLCIPVTAKAGGAVKHGCARFAVVAASAVALMCGVAGTQALAAGVVKVGVLAPISGNFAGLGQQGVTGMKMYLDQVHSMAGDTKVEIIVEDTQGKPDVGVTKARKLVERDGAQVLTGIVSSGVALAVNAYSRQHKVPIVFSIDAGADELTMPGKFYNPYAVRTSQSGRAPGAVAADWAYKKKGWRKIAVIASDYVGGVNLAHAFAQNFCRLGGKVVQVQYPPLGTPDYGPYLTNLDRSVDAVVAFTPGAGGLRLGRSYADMGLKGKIPLVDLYGQITFEPNLKQLGQAALGLYSVLHYSSMIDTDINKKFVAAYKKRTGQMPSDDGPDGWVGMHAIIDAIAAVHGDMSSPMKFVAALKAVHFNSPKGEISLDSRGQVVQSMYIREVKKTPEGLANVPIATYTHVGQYWPFTEKQFASFKYGYKELKGDLTDCAKVLAKK